MDIVWKSAVLLVITAILCSMLGNRDKEACVLLVFAACVLTGLACVHFLKPILELIQDLRQLGDVESDNLSIIIKSIGIATLAEYTCLICNDSGYSSLGKAMQHLGMLAIMWLSIPVLRSLIELICQIMGNL